MKSTWLFGMLFSGWTWKMMKVIHLDQALTSPNNHWHKSLKVTCILHMDSIKGTHGGLKNLLQSYLLEEWKERQKDTWEEALSSRFFNIRFLPVAVLPTNIG